MKERVARGSRIPLILDSLFFILYSLFSTLMHYPLTPIRCLYRAVDLYPSKAGVVCGSSRFTYAEFGERCERLGAGLLIQGVRPGDRIAYLSFNTHQLLEGYFGVLLAGGIVMPLNVRLTASELTAILNHAEPRLVIYESDFAAKALEAGQTVRVAESTFDFEFLDTAGRRFEIA